MGEWFILERFRSEWRALLRGHDVVEGMTSGPCTAAEANRLSRVRAGLAPARHVDFVVGLGGGRALDLAKATGRRLQKPVVTIPTSAATCAAWSALSAMYTRRGEALGYELLDRAPDLLLLDTRVTARAPARLLASGMADGLAKYYEAMAFTGGRVRSDDVAVVGAASWPPVSLALSSAREIHDTVWSLGPSAYADARAGRVTEPVRSVVRANIMLAGLVGGLGGEGCRAAAAHAVNNGLTRVESARRWLHGETVGLGVLAQLHLEEKKGEADRLKRLFLRIGLPTRLRDVGIVPGSPAAHRVAAWACSPRETMRNMPRRVTRPALLRALSSL